MVDHDLFVFPENRHSVYWAAGYAARNKKCNACVYYENEPGWRRRKIKEGDIMKRTVRAFAVATLICAATYERSHAAAIAPLTGIQAGSGNITLVYSPRYRIVVPLTRRYVYQPYWWPQGQYHWSPFGLERWGYWCEGGRGRQVSCGVPR